jgi:xylulokinase
VGLTVRHTHADLIRAVLEGITFNLRVILEAFGRQGAGIEALRVIGGGARSEIWNSIMADVFGVPVLRLSLPEEATTMGAAVAGGIGVGIWKDFSKVDEMVRVERDTRPDQQRHRFYTELYEIFNQIYAALDRASIFHKLAAVGS